MAVKQNVNEKSRGFGITKFFRGVKAEIKRITWPPKEEAKKAIIAVIVFTVISIALIGVMDFVFKNLFELVFGLK
ncbi:preprotein translocase subunit SecE [Clostridium perfringens]|uniref:preprotein translocase subunit SecE n=1 Tax=Clostridium perfringens TaxID=1502 RepID=UPI001ABB1978|nr:preprotein translocase subunit SecE [Clostridium perfringens]MBO3335587.1 preprotein translocase subunit SecE [Clostridium perfringens]